MSEGPTYLVVPVDSRDGLVCRIGKGREAVTNASAYAAVVTSSRIGQVLAVWKFQDRLTCDQAEEIAVKVAPSRLMICSSDDYGTLELSHSYVTEVTVIDDRPKEVKS